MSENVFVAALIGSIALFAVALVLWQRGKARRLASREVLEFQLGASGKGDAIAVAAGIFVLAVSAGTLGFGLVKAHERIGDNFAFIFLPGIFVCVVLLMATVFAVQKQFSMGRVVLKGDTLELWVPSQGWNPLRCKPDAVHFWGAEMHVGCDIQSDVGVISLRYQGMSKEDFTFGEKDRRPFAKGMPIDRVAGRELFRRISKLRGR